jgi:hypothetical protein
MMSDDEQILICAVRYALGRRTYIVSIICKYVELKLRNLSRSCIECMKKDIKEEFNRFHACGHTVGDECDEKDWLDLLEKLEATEGRDE